MSAPVQSAGMFRGPGTISLIVGLVVLAFGIYGLVTGNALLFGLGVFMFIAGVVSKFLMNDAFDTILLTLLGIGVAVGILHTVVSKTQHAEHGEAAAPSEHR